MTLPFTDWQFWVVTVAAALSTWQLVKPFLGRAGGAVGPCSQCSLASGPSCGRRAPSAQLVLLGTGAAGSPRPTRLPGSTPSR